MRVWRKNRTQYAQLFNINGSTTFGFLVGENNGIQTIETLKGEIKTISKKIKYDSKSEKKSEESQESQEFEVSIEKGENCNSEIKTYKDGRKESRMIMKI